MTSRTAFGWAGVSHGAPGRTFAPASSRDLRQIFTEEEPRSYLGRGLGRSYGDCALNAGGVVIDCRFLNRFISFDKESGVLECEAGVSLLEINRLLTDTGWILPVVPGTQFVSIGGAIANDVHGKNHIREGSFGRHVISVEIIRSNGDKLECSPGNNSELFAATIGGLGLTGLILSAKLQLRPIQSLLMTSSRMEFENLKMLFSLAAEHFEPWEYHVAWLDPAAGCRKGHYIVANHEERPGKGRQGKGRQGDLNWPRRRYIRFGPLAGLSTDLPGRLLMKSANLYYRRGIATGTRQVPAESVLYPLDRLPEWNMLFGKPGFFQYQCVLPGAAALTGLEEMLNVVDGNGQSVSLAVGKWFGPLTSPGLISFPSPGFSVALDFANRGQETLRLMDSLDKVIAGNGGRLYPAKDARMPATLFESGYPELEKFAGQTDPHFASDFWRRMNQSK